MEIFRNKKVCIMECGGMLGRAVYEKFTPHCQVLATDFELIKPWLEHGHDTDFQKISVKGQFDSKSRKFQRVYREKLNICLES